MGISRGEAAKLKNKDLNTAPVNMQRRGKQSKIQN